MTEQKVAIVTAAGRGMGAAIARELVADDYRVALMSNGVVRCPWRANSVASV